MSDIDLHVEESEGVCIEENNVDSDDSSSCSMDEDSLNNETDGFHKKMANVSDLQTENQDMTFSAGNEYDWHNIYDGNYWPMNHSLDPDGSSKSRMLELYKDIQEVENALDTIFIRGHILRMETVSDFRYSMSFKNTWCYLNELLPAVRHHLRKMDDFGDKMEDRLQQDMQFLEHKLSEHVQHEDFVLQTEMDVIKQRCLSAFILACKENVMETFKQLLRELQEVDPKPCEVIKDHQVRLKCIFAEMQEKFQEDMEGVVEKSKQLIQCRMDHVRASLLDVLSWSHIEISRLSNSFRDFMKARYIFSVQCHLAKTFVKKLAEPYEDVMEMCHINDGFSYTWNRVPHVLHKTIYRPYVCRKCCVFLKNPWGL